jgi:hypothetical protein
MHAVWLLLMIYRAARLHCDGPSRAIGHFFLHLFTDVQWPSIDRLFVCCHKGGIGIVTRSSVRIDSHVHLLVIVLVIVSWWQLTSTKQPTKWPVVCGCVCPLWASCCTLWVQLPASQLIITPSNWRSIKVTNFELIRCFGLPWLWASIFCVAEPMLNVSR